MVTHNGNDIKVFASDDNLKLLGELLSNDTSRKIIRQLVDHSMYTNQIAIKLDLRVSLVIHHLRKLEKLKLLKITNRRIKRKGIKHRYFKMSFDICITFDKSQQDVIDQEILDKIFKYNV